jgi:alkylation response protein AidB-like acyl-CoA dehydrogenase
METMNYDLNNEQLMMKNAARKFLSAESNGEFVRQMVLSEKGFTEEMWRKMVDLGWTSLIIPEEYGGIGGSFLDLCVILHEIGYSCLPGPFFSTAVVGSLLLLDAGNDEQKKMYLPEVAAGERLIAFAWLEEEGLNSVEGIQLKAQKQGRGFILDGTKLFVKDAHVANTIICAAKTGDFPGENTTCLFIVDPKQEGLTINKLNVYTGEKMFEVIFDKVQVPQENLMGDVNRGRQALKRIILKSAVARCAEMNGGAEKILELAAAYSKERTQFGRPIGAFQAIQHHCANMLMEFKTSKLLTNEAAWRISVGLDFQKEALMCKSYVSDSYRRLLKLGAQILGGTGFCEEHDFHLYCSRGKAAELEFGDAEFHREWLARELGL